MVQDLKLQDLSRPENCLLAALPTEDYQRLLPHLKFVPLSLKQTLHHPDEPIEYVYFPHQALVSLVTILENGATVEHNLIGKEGLVGIQSFLGNDRFPYQALVQIADGAMRMPVTAFKAEVQRGGALHASLLRYLRFIFIENTQGSACNSAHTIEERLALWLLTVSDRLHTNEFALTQEFIAQMLGIRRAGVTVAAGSFQQAGMIRYRRGNITILDRENLEETSCECYRVLKAERDRLLETQYR